MILEKMQESRLCIKLINGGFLGPPTAGREFRAYWPKVTLDGPLQ